MINPAHYYFTSLFKVENRKKIPFGLFRFIFEISTFVKLNL